MLYGALAGVVMAVASGDDLAPPAALAWWLALLYLALAGSILTFACFLTLQERIGPGPTGTVGVMTPLLALIVSLAFEGFRPDLLTALGAALAVAGNALMLRPAPSSPAPAGAAAREAG
jgi:drug/metabolite transporter (DMT)-like permease